MHQERDNNRFQVSVKNPWLMDQWVKTLYEAQEILGAKIMEVLKIGKLNFDDPVLDQIITVIRLSSTEGLLADLQYKITTVFDFNQQIDFDRLFRILNIFNRMSTHDTLYREIIFLF